MNGKDVYFVAVKVFLVDNQGRLLITKDRFGDWDLPGGRLKPHEFEVSLEDVVARKMTEELGENVRYEIDKPTIFMRHERMEILESGEREARRIFGLGYIAKYLGGELGMGKNHEQFEWVNIATFKPEEYLTGGWLAGVKELQKVYREG